MQTFFALLDERRTWHNKSCAEYYFPTKLMKRAAGEPADVKTKPIKGAFPPRRNKWKLRALIEKDVSQHKVYALSLHEG